MRGAFRLLIIFLCVTAIPARLAAGPSPASTHEPCMTCGGLLSLRLPEVRIDSAAEIPASRANDRKYCKVLGVIGRDIRFELLLPADWNKRFVMGGGGGFVGSIMNRTRNSVHDGFATAGTDTGHEGMHGRWALNDVERQLNFAHMAVHRTAEVSKAIIFNYYGANADFSYFVGLSRGGAQAMMEAQRYPDDFDGIVAGAPAFNWIGQAAEFIQNARAVYPEPQRKTTPLLTREHLLLLHKLILRNCDKLDGVQDSVLNDPRQCDFDLNSLPRCRGNAASPDCFTREQVEALKVVYNGVDMGKRRLHPGFPFGGEGEKTGWFPSIIGPNSGAAPYFTWQQFYGMETFRYFVFHDSLWNYPAYDFSKVYRDTRFASAFMDALNTDYSPFKKSGGKMIIYQGWIDPLISALDIIDHYEQAKSGDPALNDYIRLFMLPGVTHTGGTGPGKADWFQLVQDWVEKGVAPERVIVSKTEKNKVVMTRPVFPYPRNAVYDGKGNPDVETSFR